MVGTLTELLVEGPSEKNDKVWSGRTSQNKLVHFKPLPRVKQGDLVVARISQLPNFHLEGEILC